MIAINTRPTILRIDSLKKRNALEIASLRNCCIGPVLTCPYVYTAKILHKGRMISNADKFGLSFRIQIGSLLCMATPSDRKLGNFAEYCPLTWTSNVASRDRCSSRSICRLHFLIKSDRYMVTKPQPFPASAAGLIRRYRKSIFFHPAIKLTSLCTGVQQCPGNFSAVPNLGYSHGGQPRGFRIRAADTFSVTLTCPSA